MRICSWNINGWTNQNCLLRKSIIHKVNLNICFLNEIHLSDEYKLEIDGYYCIQYSRKSKHKNAKKFSGGVAILIKHDFLDLYESKVIDKTLDGILSVKFLHKKSDFSFVLVCCYLPPKNSVWGRDSDLFYSL